MRPSRPDGSIGTRKGERRHRLAVIRGASVLACYDRSAFRSAALKLEMIIRRSQGEKKINDGGRGHLMTLRREALDELERGIRLFRAAALFFTEKNIEQYSLWLKDRHRLGMTVTWRELGGQPRLLIRTRHGRHLGTFKVPPLDILPSEEAILHPLRRRPSLAAE